MIPLYSLSSRLDIKAFDMYSTFRIGHKMASVHNFLFGFNVYDMEMSDGLQENL